MNAVIAERVARVRAFNRYYTRVIGILHDGYLHTRWNVTEARLIFELATRGESDVVTLRNDLGLDSGYLSRILGRFEDEGVVVRKRAPRDRRRQTVALTARGKKEFTELNRRAANDIRALLRGHSEHAQRRLLAAMDAISGVLASDDGAPSVALGPARAGDFGWVIERHGTLYHAEYGWDVTFESLVARIVADYLESHDPNREAAWIARVSDEPSGCVFCVRRDEETAQLRLLLVEPHVRGLGVGSALVEQCIDFARTSGYRELVLWTNDVLVAARRIYERAGFHLVDEEPHHSFGADLIGQHWTLDL